MLQLHNKSPFAASMALFPNAQGIDTLYVIIKASFRVGAELSVSEQQVAPVMADEYFGEPGASSLRYASEMHLGKPATDVALVGHARAPRGKPVQSLQVQLRVGERAKTLQVFGDRTWSRSGITRAEPFTAMPLVYERAFGGTLPAQAPQGAQGKPIAERRNPVGVGLAVAEQQADALGSSLPNVEDPRALVSLPTDRPAPAGVGFIAASWLPRCQYGGTYDAAWQRKRAPFLPVDFDARFFCCAADELTFERYLRGGEPVAVTGVTEHGPLKFILPECQLRVGVRMRGELHTPPARLETVLIEPDAEQLSMTYRAQLACDKRALQVESVEIGLDALALGAGAGR